MMIMGSVAYQDQLAFIKRLLKLRSTLTGDTLKALDETIGQKYFLFPALHALLLPGEEGAIFSDDQLKSFIDRTHMDLTSCNYLHIKLTSPESLQEIRNGLATFEAKGEPQKVCVKHVTDILDRYE
jgi:hypothetical protein